MATRSSLHSEARRNASQERQDAVPQLKRCVLQAREALLEEEIEFRRHMTRLAEQRRALRPGPVIAKDYRFKKANGSELDLIDLFGDDDVLVTYFWVYGPQRERPYPTRPNWLGAVNGKAAEIKQRVALKILGRSPIGRQLAFATKRTWSHLDFVQTVNDGYGNHLGLIDAEAGNIRRSSCSSGT